MTLEERLKSLEGLHAQGAACEQHREQIWKALTAVRERLARLETKLLVFGSLIGVCGPLAAQLIWEWVKKK